MTAIDSDEPNSDDLAALYSRECATSRAHTDKTSFSDDIAALHDVESETKRANAQNKVVVQHRVWKTTEVFRSDPCEPPTSPALSMPYMASSPPLTPTTQTQNKRKVSELDLGQNLLARPAKAQRTYYGIDIHRLLDEAEAQESIPKAAFSLPTPPAEQQLSKKASLLWTEKYRARKFTELIGDERTHRAVMHWLKRWDPVVFPGSSRSKSYAKRSNENFGEEKPHRKILMLTGPPGLGKTTLAHVCAKQAGYEVQEINASDERSSGVVKGRIKDMVGTENVKGVDAKTAEGKVRKAGKPVCVVVDEVDGVVSGNGAGGEGGFVKALIDLVMLDQKNSALRSLQQAPTHKRKGDRFRLLRPLILVCNDVYHPALRPLRQSSLAEIIHMRKPQIQTIVNRMQTIFDKEGVPCEGDGVRRLCEATWGVSNRKEDRNGNGAGEGDMRGIMVVGEWVAGKLRAVNATAGSARLTRRWVEDHVLHDLSHGGGAARGLGRGGPKDIIDRVFKEGAGFPKTSAFVTPQQRSGNASVQGVAEGLKRTATDRLRDLIDTHGDTDRIMTDCFSSYPEHPFQDDTLLSKPDAAYEWLHFHDRLSSAVFSSNEWELAPYLSTPILGFHHLFASPTRAQYASGGLASEETASDAPPRPFTGPQASWAAHEATKHNSSVIQTLQSSLSLDLSRLFSSTADIATDLLPHVLRMLSPPVNPIIVGGSGAEKGTASVRKASEQLLVQRAVQAMTATGVRFERTKVNADEGGGAAPSWNNTQWIYRMEPSLDTLGTFETGGKAFGENGGKQRYAVRQVLEQECAKEEKRRSEASRFARVASGGGEPDAHTTHAGPEKAIVGNRAKVMIKKDFFGRPVAIPEPEHDRRTGEKQFTEQTDEGRIWVTYHEGFSNAVRKPITLAELMRDL